MYVTKIYAESSIIGWSYLSAEKRLDPDHSLVYANNIEQVLMQVPSNLLLNYCGRPSWYLGGWTIAWGLVSACTSQVKGYGDIVACRFILGLVEAPFFAGVLFYLSKWYTKKELNLRMAIFFSGSLLAGAFGNLIAGGILNGIAGARGLSAWQWLYIVEGTYVTSLRSAFDSRRMQANTRVQDHNLCGHLGLHLSS